MTLIMAVKFVCGLVLLVAGAELLVRGASRLATAWGVSPLVIGLTVVAFGTSTPEMAVSVLATLNGQTGIALGNVVGSNIFNVLFILGASALVAPLAVSAQLVRLDVPLMCVVSIVLWVVVQDGRIGIIDAGLMTAALAVYTTLLIRTSRRDEAALHDGAVPAGKPKPLLDGAQVLAGLVMLVLGSDWLVDGAVALARTVGVSDLVIGLTVIAAGTSLPELATSVLATIRGQRDIAVGNVVGSNIFNILGILGVAGLIGGGLEAAPAAIAFDIPVMTAVAVACLPVLFGGRINRWEGLLFLLYYGAYTVYLILNATGHDALDEFSRIMLLFVLPLTAMTLVLIGWQGWRETRRG